MTRRIILVVLTLALLAAAAWAYYKAEQGRASLRAAMAADAPPEPVRSAPVAAPAHSPAPSPEPSAASPHAKAAEAKPDPLPPDPGPLQPGEVLEFTANVGELSKVASLKLQIASRTDFLGKPSWHLQAFAHTMNPLRMVFELDDRFDSYSDV